MLSISSDKAFIRQSQGDQMAKRKGKKGGSLKRRDRMDSPTDATAARLEADVLLVLQEAELITLDHDRAGREIASVWSAIMRGMFGTFNAEGARSGGRHSDPTDAMTEYEAYVHATTYLPWARREATILVGHFPRLFRADLAYRVCAANQSLETIAREFEMTRAAIIEPLRSSLDNYVRLMIARPKFDVDKVQAI